MELELILADIKNRVEFLAEKRINVHSVDKNVHAQFDALDTIVLLYDDRDILNFTKYCLDIIDQTLFADDNEFSLYNLEDRISEFDAKSASTWVKSELESYKNRFFKITTLINETEPVNFKRIPLTITKNELGILIKVLYNSNIIDNTLHLKDIAYTLNRVFETRGNNKKNATGDSLKAAVSSIDEAAYAQIKKDYLPLLKRTFDDLKERALRTT